MSDKYHELAGAIHGLSRAITPDGICRVAGPSGDGQVECLTEAVLDVSASLMHISRAILELSEAVRDTNQGDRK